MTSATSNSINQRIADDIGADVHQVVSAVELLDGGATVPFISRYRKEATGGLTDTQLRLLDERLVYLRALEARREAITKEIADQGKLDSNLQRQLQGAQTKAELEDLYLPFKKKRRTKGQIAIEAGLQPLAETLWEQPSHDPAKTAAAYVDAAKGIADEKAALEGARYILMERFAEDASLIARLREQMQGEAFLCANVQAGQSAEGAKFSDYFEHRERYAKVPGHRAMAMFRGRAEGFLTLKLLLPERDATGEASYGDAGFIQTVASHLKFADRNQPADAWRAQVVQATWRIKLALHLETELFAALRARADAEAINVFATNLRDLLLSAPAGPRPTLGLDPGFRTGVKVAVVDASGKVLDHTAIYPHQPQNQWRQSVATLSALCQKYNIELIAVGNGTASRETEKLALEVIEAAKVPGLTKVMVSEAGASVYSASALAEQEFPDLDVTIRGAISIARRLQDPLAELVKIDPKAIGVGQYQHDVSQADLGRSLEATVEDCVNAVGVDLDTASSALLSRVAGLSPSLADSIIGYRDEHGTFTSRAELKKVPRLGPKAFEQAAGFLRIPKSSNPLDASGVHPEAYPVVKRIVAHAGRPVNELIGDSAYLRSLDAKLFTDEQFGVPTVKDILAELEKPGRDPRPEFQTVRFADGIVKLSDLNPGMLLEGQVTNVTAFGAFVDIGVHQDGLVHISALSDQYVKDPRDVVKAGDIVKVKVMQVDTQRKRIGLSMRLNDPIEAESDGKSKSERSGSTRDSRSGGRGDSGRQGSGRSNTAAAQQPQSGHPSALALSLQAALKRK
ncbi:MAG: RNA-binding transcriptional accessory protein [unclassified Hahellaceae]|nr:RNA-binding transcriptional accessory protein [Hahellaceae bacterium]